MQDTHTLRREEPFVAAGADKIGMAPPRIERHGPYALDGVDTKQRFALPSRITQSLQVHPIAIFIMNGADGEQAGALVNERRQVFLNGLALPVIKPANFNAKRSPQRFPWQAVSGKFLTANNNVVSARPGQTVSDL